MNFVQAAEDSAVLTYHYGRLSLRSSSDQNILVVPRVRTKHGARAFGIAAPSASNILPRNVRDCNSRKTVQESTEDVLVWSLG